jgi:hypothetical protein
VICGGCGGLVGRDCFNPQECEWITRDMQMRAERERALYRQGEEEYHREQEEAYWREREADFDMMRLEETCMGLA